jgi:uncharacterized BrkB/YihY/UPF0761 family membrane protein
MESFSGSPVSTEVYSQSPIAPTFWKRLLLAVATLAVTAAIALAVMLMVAVGVDQTVAPSDPGEVHQA